MADFEISAEHNAARMAATIAFADGGTEPSRIQFFSATEVLLATVVLAKPCGTVQDGFIRLAPAEASGNMIVADGEAATAVWVSGTGTLVARGNVSDETGDGPFVLQGTDGTHLYAGGRAILGATEIA